MMESLGLSIVVAVGVMEIGLFWYVARSVRGQSRLEQRVQHLTDALSLLTETAEAGFRANAAEIGRMAEAARPARASRKTSSRVARARTAGRTVAQIAADEEMSEGEVHLRLQLNDDSRATRSGDRRRRTRTRASAGTSQA